MIAPRPLSASTPAPTTPRHDPAPDRLAEGWALLHEAGQALSSLAQLGDEATPIAPAEFATRAAAAGPARLMLAEQAMDDCCAALHAGLSAIIAGAERGKDTTAAALTLWREFDRAREALVGLIAPAH